jgi:hypothetical protein
MVSSPWVVLLVMMSPVRMDNSSEGSKLPSLLTSLVKTGNYSNRGIAASLQDLTRLFTGKFACEAWSKGMAGV